MVISLLEDVEHRGRDKFVTVSVAVKPKMTDPSNPSNWENDRYVVRLNFREKHEVPASCGNVLGMTDAIWQNLIFLRDSLFKFKVMNVAGDYLRVIEGSDHLEREKLRLIRLLNRITYAREQFISRKSEKQDLHGICAS